jgi:hypothetical protein
MKNATFHLPMLDILHQRYPKLLKSLKHCFYCNTEIETNEHFWTCSQTISSLSPIFIKHESILKTLISTHTDKFDSQLEASIKMSKLFSWTRIPNFTLLPSHPLYIFFTWIYTKRSITYFTFHIKTHKKTKSLLLSFIHNLTFEI